MQLVNWFWLLIVLYDNKTLQQIEKHCCFYELTIHLPAPSLTCAHRFM